MEPVGFKLNKKLKEVVKESIKQLMNEQLPPGACPTLHKYRGYLSSTFGPTTNPGHNT